MSKVLLLVFCFALAVPYSEPRRGGIVLEEKESSLPFRGESWGRSPITALAFSPNGKTLLTGGYKSVEERTPDGKIVRRLDGDLSKIHDLAFSSNGKILAVGGGQAGISGTALLFDWPSGTLQQTLPAHADTVNALAFSPNGKTLATAGADKKVYLHRSDETGKFQRRLSLIGHTGPVTGVAFSPNGKTLVTSSADRSLKVWDIETGNLLRALTNHTSEVHCVVFAPQPVGDNPLCASGSEDKTVRVWMPEIGRMVRIIRNHEGATFALAFSRDGKMLFSAGTEGVIRAIDAESDTILRAWKAHNRPIYSLVVSPDGKTLASGDWSGAIRVEPLPGIRSRDEIIF